MRSIELLNINSPEHAGFVFDLLMACKDTLLDDYENDIIMVIKKTEDELKSKAAVAFLCRVNGQPCGLIWVSNTPKEIGEIHAAMMPVFRGGLGKHALYFLKEFIPFCFNTLKYRKLRAMIPIYNRPAERMLRFYGFKKAGLHHEETLKNGKPITIVELSLTKNQFRGLQNDQQQQKQNRTAKSA